MSDQVDFSEWKEHPVTRAYFRAVEKLIYEGQVELGNSAGRDPYLDAYRSGKIRGLAELIMMEAEEL
jgi:hypothetical protein